MFAKLESLERQFADLESQLSAPDIFNDQERYKKLTKARADLAQVVACFQEFKKLSRDLEDNREMLADTDPEIRAMAESEIASIKQALPRLEEKLQLLLLPKDPLDEKDVILEIRAGTGGEEASLFAADLFRMYMRYAERVGWKVEMLSEHESATGGFKEVIASISGERVYSRLKYESGIHRVQRVPATETQGRIHTSAVTVAVLPEAEEVDLDIDPTELRIDVYRASGAGGQHVNKTESAVRITHLPTNTVVTCQDEKSQHKNKAKAMKVLRSRILQSMQAARKDEEDAARRLLVGSGDRSGRIRTYNFPQGRITDHRINLTLYSLAAVMEGALDDLVEALIGHYQTEALKQQAASA
ncbi:peptide chain release factor 1 [Desulfocurvibacter africanus]|uniref:peptide chain release factor 1 n=1 Tax=Desulfocurvibacter africanus TaxID=873 RepID=UPI00041EA973|nr:peptide chain release factor 1 [Desulfocurvibacter africanus]